MESYLHGYDAVEKDRLLAQAEHWRERLIVDSPLAPGTRLLDVGCGVGAVLGILGQAFTDVRLAGVDNEQRHIDFARAPLAGLGLQADLRCADGGALPFADHSF